MNQCRHCQQPLTHQFINLAGAPPSNAYLSYEELYLPEIYFPLRVMVCDQCWLVQTQDYAPADALFDKDYAYFSSTSKSWLAHAKHYSKMIIARQQLDKESFVVEIASNDGYLLRNFVEYGIPCLGIEPTASTAEVAQALNIPVQQRFFNASFASELATERQADLIVGNNVFAHVPDINDFTQGLRLLLKPDGIITLEFPHLLQLIQQVQFDTVYHEHFSYLSLYSVQKILSLAHLRVFDVETFPTHGGSLRLYICHNSSDHIVTSEVQRVLYDEVAAGLQDIGTYLQFQERANKVKNDLLMFLLEQKSQGKKVAGYGAAAKGNTLLNFAGVKVDLLPFICDAAPSKQGKFMPGSHIPILAPSALEEYEPDYVLIFPWNIANEVKIQLSGKLSKETKFIVPIPELREI